MSEPTTRRDAPPNGIDLSGSQPRRDDLPPTGVPAAETPPERSTGAGGYLKGQVGMFFPVVVIAVIFLAAIIWFAVTR